VQEFDKILLSTNKSLNWNCSHISVGCDGWPADTLVNLAKKLLVPVTLPVEFLSKVAECLADIHLVGISIP